MTTESATYIADLNTALPAAATSPISADDHLRLIKSVLQASFPNVSDAVTASDVELTIVDGCTATAAELNKMAGVTVTAAEIEYADALTSALQTQIAAKRNALTVQTKTSNFTAQSNYYYITRPTSTNANCTLPASPSAGDVIMFADHGDGYSGYINTPYTFNGVVGAALFNLANKTVKLVYVDATTGWAKHDAAT